VSLFALISVVIVMAALFAFANYRFIGLPTTIGVTLMALVISLALIAAAALGLPIRAPAAALLERLHFGEVLLDGMLAFLLFAGALSVDLGELLGQKLVVGVLATAGVVASTLIVGGLTFLLSRSLGLGFTLLESLLFGAIVSPTDPIAVLGILRSTSAPKALAAQMAGESLFNDGIGVVVFSVLIGLAGADGASAAGIGFGTVVRLLATQVLGSLLLGLAAGWLTYLMLRAVDNYQVEALLTLALAMGVYSLATELGLSGPLAVVVAGLLIGGVGRSRAMSARTVEQVDKFWELIDEVLNVVLFVLIGFEILVVPFSSRLLAMGLAAVVLVLFARYLSVGGTILALRRVRRFEPHAIKILTWGGLRGGLSLAMALSLGPQVANRHAIQGVTYVVAVFSIAVQGLTFGKLVRATGLAGPDVSPS
jgi:CPA1 family monovalent cation:H+ antiporter